MPFDLDGEFSEGQTTADYLKSSAEQAAKTYYAIESEAEEQKITLTKEQEKQLEDYVNSLDATSVAYYGTTAEDQRTTFKQNLLSEGLNKKLTDSGEIAATDENLAQYVKDQGLYNCRYILYDVAEDADEKTDKEQKEKAQAAYDELSKLSGEEQLKKFQEYQKQNHDGNTDEFSFNPTSTINEDFRAKVESMKVGELGMTDKTSFGYFVLLRLDVDTESLKEEYLQKAYNDRLTQWAEEAEAKPTAEMDKLDVKAVCTKLLELQNSINDAAQAAVSADESSAEGRVPVVDAAEAAAEGSAS
jgi:parvulin-like peptidyl-prolyl isomerase